MNKIIAGQGQRGTLLETLVAYLLRTIPGLEPVNRTVGKGGEIDIRVLNSGRLGQPLKWFEDYFLVECKDTKKPVDEKEVGHFLIKMLLNKTHQGAIVSKSGLTGGGRNSHASRDRKLAYSQLNLVVLDINTSDLRGLRSYMDLLRLLQRKYEELRFL